MNASIPDCAALLEALAAAPPDERVARLRAAGDPEDVLLALGDEAERLCVVEVSRALEAAELVVSLGDMVGSQRARARGQRAEARALAYAGRMEEALASWRRATSLADGVGAPVEAAKSRLASMQALGELGRLEDAIAEGETARGIFESANEPDLAARADANLGIVYQRSDEPDKALFHFDRARASALMQEPVAAGKLDSNRGEALLALNDFAGAEDAFLSALEALESTDGVFAAAIVEGNLADLAARQGRLERALDYFERARRHLEADTARGHLARLLAEQADALAVLGMLTDALGGYNEALHQLDECGLALEAARARAGMGTVLLRLGRHTEAETALAAAAKAFDDLGHGTARARVDVIRGELAASIGRPEEAYVLTSRALDVLDTRPAESAIARYHLARLALNAGDIATAQEELAKAIPVARQLDVAPLLADLLHTRGLVHQAKNNPKDAVDDFSAAVDQVERVRGSLQAEQFRAAYLTDRLGVYHDLVRALLESPDQAAIGRAFVVAEQAKSRSLLDIVRGAIVVVEPIEADAADPAEAQLIRDLVQRRGEVNALYSRLGGTNRLGETPQITTQWREAVRERERELRSLENRLASTRGVAALYAPPVGLEEVHHALAADTALIEYFVAGDELLAFVLIEGHTYVVRDLATSTTLAERVRRLRFQINRALRRGATDGPRGQRLLDDAQRELSLLYEMVAQPLMQFLSSTKRLIIIPHGPLHLIPFAALWDGRQYLIDRYELHSAPSASLLQYLARTERTPRLSDQPVVVGAVDEVAPCILAEATRIATCLGCDRPLLGDEATADRVMAAAANASVLHLACHGQFSADAPMASGLKLADRWLTVRDIYSLRLRADLVTLSGCETGRNLITAGDELVGLLGGFFAAGARSALVSLWRVNDESTTNLMADFYSLWHAESSDRMPLAAALREAQLTLRRQRAHPAFWAPFILVGEP
ncbi:MAG: CHAT domain-containing protein [Planctomycetes bacterium]|nr:CHAT domain-containing protein [Planctomycetota bacterium]